MTYYYGVIRFGYKMGELVVFFQQQTSLGAFFSYTFPIKSWLENATDDLHMVLAQSLALVPIPITNIQWLINLPLHHCKIITLHQEQVSYDDWFIRLQNKISQLNFHTKYYELAYQTAYWLINKQKSYYLDINQPIRSFGSHGYLYLLPWKVLNWYIKPLQQLNINIHFFSGDFLVFPTLISDWSKIYQLVIMIDYEQTFFLWYENKVLTTMRSFDFGYALLWNQIQKPALLSIKQTQSLWQTYCQLCTLQEDLVLFAAPTDKLGVFEMVKTSSFHKRVQAWMQQLLTILQAHFQVSKIEQISLFSTYLLPAKWLQWLENNLYKRIPVCFLTTDVFGVNEPTFFPHVATLFAYFNNKNKQK